MRTIFRITDQMIGEIRRDLQRPHDFAAERVGFISVRADQTASNLLLIGEGYHPVADEEYVDDASVGAMMGQEAIRKALDIALLKPVGMFHVHLHSHRGRPRFSPTDVREQRKFVPDFFKVRPHPHGAIVLSFNQQYGTVWMGPTRTTPISEFNIIGPRFSADILEKF
ncbi:MAG TPA: hypothetical protein VF651_06355 [Gammaproteobacteria bacterium]